MLYSDVLRRRLCCTVKCCVDVCVVCCCVFLLFKCFLKKRVCDAVVWQGPSVVQWCVTFAPEVRKTRDKK